MSPCHRLTRATAFIITILKRHPHMQLAGDITMVGPRVATTATMAILLRNKKRTFPNAARARRPRGDDQGAVCKTVPRGLFTRVSTRFANLAMPNGIPLDKRVARRSVQALAPGFVPTALSQTRRSSPDNS